MSTVETTEMTSHELTENKVQLLEGLWRLAWMLSLTCIAVGAQPPPPTTPPSTGGKKATSGGAAQSKPNDAVRDVVARTFSPAPLIDVPERLAEDLDALSN